MSNAQPTVRPTAAAVWRMRAVATCGVLFAAVFLQAPGRMVADTKLDLVENPLGFLGRALHLWEPEGFAGQLQNQAYGYLFPIGPFFAAGHLLGLPGWAIQRLWWGVVLCTAFLGARAVAARLGIGTPATQLLAGLAYALAPRMISTLGPVSAETWPMAVAPWILLPLIAVRGRTLPARSVTRSALALALAGGVNAALSFAAALPALLYLLTRRLRGDGLRLLVWWCGAALLATLWWLGPLLLLGSYSPPFLDYIESARNTTATTWLVETLRGTDHWVAYLGAQLGSTWQAGLDLVTNPALILDTLIVAGLGLAGLALRSMPERRWLCCVLMSGLLMVTFGHVGALDGLFAVQQQELLDGVLAPLRNVHKFDPLIRLPLALGLAHVLSRISWGREPAERRLTARTVKLVAVLAVAGMASPALVGRLAPSGSYEAVPAYWHEAAAWLDMNASGRALLAPGSRFGTYVWGTTQDEPLQPLTSAGWEVRNAVPLVQPGHIRLLDALERRFASGRPSSGLAAVLRRSGVQYVVVRNDLAYAAGRSSRPVQVRSVLGGSAGLQRVATFGRVRPEQPAPGTVFDARLQGEGPAVEIWRVTGPPPARVSLVPLDQVSRISGGPESLLDLADSGLLPARAAMLAGSEGSDLGRGPVVVTDGMRRREVDYGASVDNTSATLAAGDPLRLNRVAPDYLPFDDARHFTVGTWHGAEDVQVSSSRADAGVLGGSDPARQPAAAFDGSADTAWVAAPGDVLTPWIEARLDRPRRIPAITVRLLPDSARVLESVVLIVDGVGTTVPVSSPVVRIPLPDAEVRTVRVELHARRGAALPLGIAELDGLGIRHGLRVPSDEPAGRAVDRFSFAAADGHSDGCVTEGERVVCVPALLRSAEDDERLDRTFATSRVGEFRLSLQAAPRAGAALTDKLAVATRPTVTAVASSVAVDAPASGAAAAVDGRPGTGWTADPDDDEPSLSLRWDRPIELSTLRMVTSPDLPASPPAQIAVTVGSRTVRAGMSSDGVVELPRVRADRLTITVPSQPRTASYDPVRDTVGWLPWGISEVRIAGLPGPRRTDEAPVRFGCGQGPEVTIDGRAYPTRVEATTRQLETLSDVEAIPCGPDGASVRLRPGEHRLVMTATAAWRPVRAGLRADTATSIGGGVLSEPRVLQWGEEARAVALDARSGGSLLAIPENLNAGWRATLGGRELRAVQVDGWQQAFAVPAGPAGVVRLTFEPAVPYRVALWWGLAALVVLVLLAIRFSRYDEPVTATPAQPGRIVRAAGALVASALLAGLPGLVVMAVAITARTALSRYGAVWAAASAAGLAIAGCVLIARPWGSASGYGADDLFSQLLCLVTIAMVVAPTAARRPDRATAGPAARPIGTAARPAAD